MLRSQVIIDGNFDAMHDDDEQKPNRKCLDCKSMAKSISNKLNLLLSGHRVFCINFTAKTHLF